MDDEFAVPFENIEPRDLSAATEEDPAFENSPIDERLFDGLEETRVDTSFIEERSIDESVIEEWPIDESVVEEELIDFDSQGSVRQHVTGLGRGREPPRR